MGKYYVIDVRNRIMNEFGSVESKIFQALSRTATTLVSDSAVSGSPTTGRAVAKHNQDIVASIASCIQEEVHNCVAESNLPLQNVTEELCGMMKHLLNPVPFQEKMLPSKATELVGTSRGDAPAACSAPAMDVLNCAGGNTAAVQAMPAELKTSKDVCSSRAVRLR